MSLETDTARQPGFGTGYRQSLQTLAFLALNIVLVALAVLLFGDWHSFLSVLRRINAAAFLPIILLALGNYFLRGVRYYYLNRCTGIHMPFLRTLLYYVAGFSFSVTPGKLGEVARGWLIRRDYGVPLEKSISVVFVDRVGDVLATFVLCLATLSLFSGYWPLIASVCALIVIGLAILLNPRFIELILDWMARRMPKRAKLFEALKNMLHTARLLLHPQPLLVSLVLGIAAWSLEGMALSIAVQHLGGHLDIFPALFIYGFANLAGGLTFLPGGIGGTEAVMLTLLYSMGVDAEIAAATTLLIRAGTLWFGVGLGLLASFAAGALAPARVQSAS